MMEKPNKRDRSALLRSRILEAMARKSLSRSALARAAGVDRSTIAQLLAEDAVRMPNAQLAADAAQALGVSADWLLGLTDRPERPGDLLAAAIHMSAAERSAATQQIRDWHREAAGYKIRHVPATLPEMLKTQTVRLWEFGAEAPPEAGWNDGLGADFFAQSASDFEIALPLQEMTAFAEGSGYYRGLGQTARRAQLDALAEAADAHYPRLRLSFFDARKVYSAPVTLFGPLVGALYVGRFYLAFRERSRIRSLTEHFDWLVRSASIGDRAAADWLDRLARDLS
ncbi:MAG: helix-turn-helix domain-containing protein [Pseudomonadota bacterium]